MSKPIKVRIYFNRPHAEKRSPLIWTVRTARSCFQVKMVKSYVPMIAASLDPGVSPRPYLEGRAYVHVNKSVAYLWDDYSSEHMDEDEYFEAMYGS